MYKSDVNTALVSIATKKVGTEKKKKEGKVANKK